MAEKHHCSFSIENGDRQTREICVQSVLVKWYCGCLTISLEIEWRNVGRRDKSWGELQTLTFEEGRSATLDLHGH